MSEDSTNIAAWCGYAFSGKAFCFLLGNCDSLTLPKFKYASHFPLSVLFHRKHYSQFIQILVDLPILLNTSHPWWHVIVIRYAPKIHFLPHSFRITQADTICYKQLQAQPWLLSLLHTTLQQQDSSECKKAWNRRTGIIVISKQSSASTLGKHSPCFTLCENNGYASWTSSPHLTKLRLSNAIIRACYEGEACHWEQSPDSVSEIRQA